MYAKLRCICDSQFHLQKFNLTKEICESVIVLEHKVGVGVVMAVVEGAEKNKKSYWLT